MSLFPLDRILGRLIRHGHLTVIDSDGEAQAFGEATAQPAVTVRLHDSALKWQLTWRPTLAVGEAYADGRLTIEKGTLRDFLKVLLVSQDLMLAESALYPIQRKAASIYRLKDTINRIGRAERNVQHHYDISQRLYELFLDKDMQYSCAYWRDGTTSLETAQLDKRRHLAKKLLLQPGMEVLDIGCGWGGLGLHLAREHGVKVTGVTLSKDQHETAVRRAAEAGLSDQVTFKLIDYRLEPDKYDRIVSVGMFEHVGKPYFKEFFDHVDRLLRPDGVAVLHTIAKMKDPGPINAWIRKYIFPGAYVPTLSELAPIIEKRGLWLTDMENWRLHYSKTLHAWDQRFQARRDEVARMFDERFCRIWEFYLQSCEISFSDQELCVFQLQLAKKIDAVPTTRDYMYADEPLPARVRSAARPHLRSVGGQRPVATKLKAKRPSAEDATLPLPDAGVAKRGRKSGGGPDAAE